MNDTTRTAVASVGARAGAAQTAPAPARPTPRRTRRRSIQTSQWAAWAFLAPVTAYLLLFYAYPLYKNLDLSLRNYTVASFVHGGAPFAGFGNYATVIHDPTFAPALWHTVLFTGASLLFQFALGLWLAVFFQQHF